MIITIREYLFSLYDSMNSFKVKIDYYVYDICPDRKCIHYDNCTLGETYHDKEYSPSFDSLEETKKMISEKNRLLRGLSMAF